MTEMKDKNGNTNVPSYEFHTQLKKNFFNKWNNLNNRLFS